MTDMIEVFNKKDYTYLFESYDNNIPVIYSSLNGQYNGQLYVDNIEKTNFAVLCTPFDFIYVAGDSTIPGAEDMIEKLIFEYHLPKYKQGEAVTFCPDDKWDKLLDSIYAKHPHVKDVRLVYKLNSEIFEKHFYDHKLNTNFNFELVQKQDNESSIVYPVSIATDESGKEIGFCAAFMLGDGHAEIEISTDEAFRQRGIAKELSFQLIKHLLSQDITPDWCCWPFRSGSQILAESLGFALYKTIPAHIWNIEMK